MNQNDSSALVWYRKSALSDDIRACIAVGDYFESGGNGIRRNFQAAINWDMKAAEQNSVEAQNRLAYLYLKLEGGEPSDKDYQNAFYWLKMAAEQGDASAQYNVGIFYYYGHGVDRNPEEAIKWIGMAADQGSEAAHAFFQYWKNFNKRFGL